MENLLNIFGIDIAPFQGYNINGTPNTGLHPVLLHYALSGQSIKLSIKS